MAGRKFGRVLDIGILVLMGLSLFYSAITISSKRYYWMDEVITHNMATDSSFEHMIQAVADNVDSGPPAYPALIWLWDHLFGSSDLTLRLLSTSLMSVACVLTYCTMRKGYTPWISFAAVACIFWASVLVIYHNEEARCYGLLMALGAAALYLFVNIGYQPEFSRKLFILNFLVHSLLVWTHFLGAVYSGFFLIAFLLRDIHDHCSRSKWYVSIGLAWLTFIPWIGPLREQTMSGLVNSWIVKPDFKNLIIFYGVGTFTGLSSILIFLLVIVGLIIFLLRPKLNLAERNSEHAPTGLYSSRLSITLMGMMLLLAPIAGWLFSVLIRPIFVPRYYILTTLGGGMLFAQLMWFIGIKLTPVALESSLSSNRFSIVRLKRGISNILPVVRYVGFLATISILGYNYFSFIWISVPENKPGAALEQLIQAQDLRTLPIVNLSANSYLPSKYYAANPSQHFYILDWDLASDPVISAVGMYSENEIMSAQLRNYYDPNILTTQEFLARYSRFLVLDMASRHWMERRVESNPAYHYRVLGQLQYYNIYEPVNLILVEKDSLPDN